MSLAGRCCTSASQYLALICTRCPALRSAAGHLIDAGSGRVPHHGGNRSPPFGHRTGRCTIWRCRDHDDGRPGSTLACRLCRHCRLDSMHVLVATCGRNPLHMYCDHAAICVAPLPAVAAHVIPGKTRLRSRRRSRIDAELAGNTYSIRKTVHDGANLNAPMPTPAVAWRLRASARVFRLEMS